MTTVKAVHHLQIYDSLASSFQYVFFFHARQFAFLISLVYLQNVAKRSVAEEIAIPFVSAKVA